MRRYRKSEGALKRKMLTGMLLILIPVLVLITILFWHTRSVLKKEYIRTARYDLRDISREVDEKIEEISYMSDAYLANEELNDYAERSYDGSDTKQIAIIRIYRDVLDTIDRMNRREKLSAIYTARGELLNFLDPNQDVPEIREQLDEMDVNAEEHLMKFVWHPVRENFLISDPPENIHERMAVYGTRRVYSWTTGRYEYVQIFALEEAVFYQMYKEKVDALRGEFYIINQNDELISASNDKALEEGHIPERFRNVLKNKKSNSFEISDNGEKKLVNVETCAEGNWTAVMIVPVREITKDMSALYLRFSLILLICMGISSMCMMWLYKSFMEPVGRLNHSMKEVYDGNLNAYVEVRDKVKKNEMGEMLGYYNSMLHRINTHIIDELKADRKKKELELEVLMSQINPHFLYNTLETIVWKSNMAGHSEIGRIAASLGRMYRLSISGGRVIVPFENEIEHLMAYVKIQQNRYGDRIKFDLRTDMKQIHLLYSLKILLQPLAENAFLYGSEDTETKMIIRVTVREKDGWVTIRVADNGCGMEKRRLEQVRRQIRDGRKEEDGIKKGKSTGIGLHSIQSRIRLYFGIENAVSIYSKKDKGTLVLVRIPKITKENIDENGNLKES